MASVQSIRANARRRHERRAAQFPMWMERPMVRWMSARQAVSADDPQTALTHGAVYACVSKIVGLFSAMEVTTWTRAGGVERQLDVSPQIVANPSPDPSLDQPHWLAQVVTSWLLRGDAFGLVVDESSSGWPTKIDVVDPDRVRHQTIEGRTRWIMNGKEESLWAEGGRLWHVPSWMTLPGTVLGVDPITQAAMDVGVGLSAREYGAAWFASGGHPSAVLENDQPVAPEVAGQVQQRWVEAMEKGGREPRALGAGWKYKAIQVNPDQAQMIEMLQANVADVCRWFGVPPEEIGGSSGDSNTYSNVEGRSVQLLRNMAPWLSLVQRMWTALLPSPLFVRLDPSVVLRLTPKVEAQVWTERVRGGMWTPNEARTRMGMPPLPGGDELVWPPYRTSDIGEPVASPEDGGEDGTG